MLKTSLNSADFHNFNASVATPALGNKTLVVFYDIYICMMDDVSWYLKITLQ